jgi:hypothetical protein
MGWVFTTSMAILALAMCLLAEGILKLISAAAAVLSYFGSPPALT